MENLIASVSKFIKLAGESMAFLPVIRAEEAKRPNTLLNRYLSVFEDIEYLIRCSSFFCPLLIHFKVFAALLDYC